LRRPQGRQVWLTGWQALGLASPDLTLPIHWDDDGQQRDDLVAISPLRHVAGRDIYASFLKWAEASGRAFYPFAYDWRRGNEETVEKFLEFLDAVNAQNSGAKVQVVAHSMGGLVSFVALNRRPDLFHSILFAGVPFGHAISFLEDMHAGTATGLNKRILNPPALFTFASLHCFFPWNRYESGLVERTGERIQHDWYSSDDWEGRKLGIFGTLDPAQVTGEMRSHLRNALGRARVFRSMLAYRNELQYPPVAVLASDAHLTLSLVVRMGPRAVKGWDFKNRLREPGDGRVLFSKARPPDGVLYTLHKTRHDHGALLRDTSQVSGLLAQLCETANRRRR
jgi:pimeloyl-ACP methyl ester carboxylesterase